MFFSRSQNNYISLTFMALNRILYWLQKGSIVKMDVRTQKYSILFSFLQNSAQFQPVQTTLTGFSVVLQTFGKQTLFSKSSLCSNAAIALLGAWKEAEAERAGEEERMNPGFATSVSAQGRKTGLPAAALKQTGLKQYILLITLTEGIQPSRPFFVQHIKTT